MLINLTIILRIYMYIAMCMLCHIKFHNAVLIPNSMYVHAYINNGSDKLQKSLQI